MLLILSAPLGLATKKKQVDYTLGFAQVPLADGETIYVEILKGY